MMGTSIQDLHQKEKMDQYDSIRKMQDMSQDNLLNNSFKNQQLIQQPNQIPFYNMQQASSNLKPSPNELTKAQNFNRTQQLSLQNTDINDLAKDINDNLDDDTFISLSDTTEENNIQKNTKENILNSIPQILREPIIILLIYLFLSRPFVQEKLSKYIKQLAPDQDGKVSFAGVFIYGIILVVLYSLAKNFLLE